MTTLHSSTSDPVAKAIAMLELLDDATKEQVLGRMDPEIRRRIEDRIASTPDGSRPHDAFSADISARRRLLREAAHRLHNQRIEAVDEAVTPPESGDSMVAQQLPAPGMPASMLDPLGELQHVHPAAIARAMQGERAEAWAIVLDRLEPSTRGALEAYLDPAASAAIVHARARQAELRTESPAMIATIERAIARTVVTAAMREHQILLSTTPGAGHGAAL